MVAQLAKSLAKLIDVTRLVWLSVGGTLLRRLIELAGEHFVSASSQSLFDEPTGLAAAGASKALGSYVGFPRGLDDNLDGSTHERPPTLMVNLTEPSANGCSMTAWPLLRASILARSTA